MDLDTLYIKLNMANDLRIRSNEATKSAEKIAGEWIQKEEKCKTQSEIKKLNAEYSKKFDRADKKEAEAYKDYWVFVDRNFDSRIVRGVSSGGNFMNKEFINKLGTATKKQMKLEKKRNSKR